METGSPVSLTVSTTNINVFCDVYVIFKAGSDHLVENLTSVYGAPILPSDCSSRIHVNKGQWQGWHWSRDEISLVVFIVPPERWAHAADFAVNVWAGPSSVATYQPSKRWAEDSQCISFYLNSIKLLLS